MAPRYNQNSRNDDEDEVALFRKAMSDLGTQPGNYHRDRNNPLADLPRPPANPARTRPLRRGGISANIPGNTTYRAQSPGSDQFIRPGLQKNIIRKLKRGQYPISANLDLHGYKKFEAENILEQFIAEARQERLACVLIIHGKGNRSQGGQGVLRQFTFEWLRKVSVVKAYCPAQSRHGGSGATYVLLKTGGR